MFKIRCPNYFIETLATHRIIFNRQLTNCYPSNEIQFPVSWSHIAGQEWGNSNGIPVLAVHGWLDNSGSFEPLVPHLLARHNLHIVTIDEPGCGLSSHKPRGSDYNRWSHFRDMKNVLDQLDWSKDVTLIGHSLGAIYSLMFASVYPSIVKRVVSLDIVKPPTSWLGHVSGLPKIIEKHKPLKGGYTFTRDIRQKLPPLDPCPSEGTIIKMMTRIRSDLLIVRAKNGVHLTNDSDRQFYYSIYERNCRLFRDALTDGTHHFHMNNNQNVGKVINQFLSDSFDC